MTDEPTNIVAFKPKPEKVPAIGYVELRLLGDECDIQMTLHDDDGTIVATIEYAITAKPENFDLQRLIGAWHEWRARGCATTAV